MWVGKILVLLHISVVFVEAWCSCVCGSVCLLSIQNVFVLLLYSYTLTNDERNLVAIFNLMLHMVLGSFFHVLYRQ